MTPLAFLRQVAYAQAREVAIVQTGPADQIVRIVERAHRIFPSSELHVVLRPDSAAIREMIHGAHVEVAPAEDRQSLVARLRRKRFDVVAFQLSGDDTGDLMIVPFLLRGRSIVAFNQNLDHFPLNLDRIATLAQHFGIEGEGSAGVLHVAGRALGAVCVRAVGVPAVALWLAATAGWIHVRGFARRVAGGHG